MSNFFKKNPLLVFILLLAAFCRLYRIGDYMEFLGDQGRDAVIVRDFLANGNLFFIGPQTSIGNMYLGPFYYYLIAPSLLLANYNPVGPAIFVALLGVITVALVYYLGRSWFDHRTALIASLLYALSPTVIKYSNFSWNPNIMPLFSLLFVHFFHQKKYFLASLAFIMVINSHYLGLLLLPLAFIIWLQNQGYRDSFKSLFLAIILFLVSLTPLVLFDLKHQGQNLKSITTFFADRQTTVNAKFYKAAPKLLPLHFQITTSLPAAKNQVLGYILGTIIIIGTGYLLYTKNFKPTFILWWYFISLIGLGAYKQHVYDHYFGFIFPLLFIILAKIISQNRYFALAIIIPVIFFSILNSPLRYPLNQLSSSRQVSQLILDQAAGQPFNLALIAKQNYDPPYRYFLYQANAPLYDIKDKLTDQLFVICEPANTECQPINHPEFAIAAFGWAKIDRQWQLDGRIVFRLVHTQ